MADLREKLARMIDPDSWDRFSGCDCARCSEDRAPSLDAADRIIAALPELLVTPERVERLATTYLAKHILHRDSLGKPFEMPCVYTGPMREALTAALTEPGDR